MLGTSRSVRTHGHHNHPLLVYPVSDQVTIFVARTSCLNVKSPVEGAFPSGQAACHPQVGSVPGISELVAQPHNVVQVSVSIRTVPWLGMIRNGELATAGAAKKKDVDDAG